MPESLAKYSTDSERLEAAVRTEARALGESERQDAFSAGIVKGAAERAGEALATRDGSAGRGRAVSSKPSPAGAEKAKPKAHLASQAKGNLKRAIADAAVSEADDSEELSGIERASGAVRGARSVIARRAASKKAPAASKAKGPLKGAAKHAKAGALGHGAAARARHAAASQASAGAAKAAASAGGKGAVVGAVSSVAVPVAGVLAAVMAFLLAVLAISQIVSALFGFWQNEASKASLEGLPPYITYEMVEESLSCQEEYGHPAGCTLAQIIVESGQGDHMSRLATRDHNLFGMKWAPSFAAAPEVAGKANWVTGEEVDGAHVTITDSFTVFKSDADSIKFRSRVFLASSTYSGNALIGEAVSERSSDKMAEGLKDAGWATDSAYVEKLKAVMDQYGLRAFDAMAPGDLANPSAGGASVIAAAFSQLGVPYVWGGTTPGVGLDCSGLTQWCYRQAGISIPRNSEDQAAAGTKIPLSMAEPGDVLWRPGHVAIYIGDDSYIHEPQTGDVCKVSQGISYFTCALRFK